MAEVSVLMSVYNGEMHLREAIDSILGQSFKDFEFIIINDCSTDGSLDIIKSYRDVRIKLVENNKNLGLTASLNKGIDIAIGKYIARMDADDVAHHDRLKLQYEYMQTNTGIMVLGSRYRILGTNKVSTIVPLKADEVKLYALTQCPLGHPTAFIRKEALNKAALRYDTAIPYAQDYDLWARVLEVGAIENLPEVLLDYRRHNAQISSTKLDKQNETSNAIRLRQLKKLIDFTGKPYDAPFVLRILVKESFGVTTDDMVKVSAFITDMWKGNEAEKIYNPELFKDFLKDIWAFYLERLSGYYMRNYAAIMNNPYGLKKSNLLFSLKYWLGAIWGLRHKK